MFLDAQTEMSAAQAVTATAVSTNVIDLTPLKSAKRNVGAGQPLFVVIHVPEAAAAVGAATVNFQIVTDDNAALSSPTVLYDSGSIAKTALTLNREPIVIAIPDGAEKYLAMNYVVGTGPLTAGKFSARVVLDPQRWAAYARNYAV